jgi:tetratricopeptide (TPR) repeat protein
MTSRASELTRGESAHYEVIARRLLMAGKYAEPIAPLLEAARLAPSDAGVLNDLGVAYMATRRFAEAVTWLRLSIVLQPGVGDTHYNLGLALQHTGGRRSGHRRASPVQLSSPTSLPARTVSSPTCYGRRECGAKQSLHTSARILSRRPPLWVALAHALLGRVLQESGRFDEAMGSFERSISIDPWQASLDWNSACLRPEENRDAVRTASSWQARQPIYTTSVDRWRHYEPWIGELRGLL